MAKSNPKLKLSFDGIRFIDSRLADGGNALSIEPPDPVSFVAVGGESSLRLTSAGAEFILHGHGGSISTLRMRLAGGNRSPASKASSDCLAIPAISWFRLHQVAHRR